uniref:Pentacotripeptide-repeat region of PRORP domain-containing protein n=1 Tax=Lotharella globosa TaxID=91324 RepID=A0A6U3C7J8_9EUKA|mmetsp:Transcript_18501/g.37345  ORF Transcript_18501/g.37345 Transcript_18501/m.37345 type:complete len:478 (+) Transcript_18501:853-2286(+)
MKSAGVRGNVVTLSVIVEANKHDWERAAWWMASMSAEGIEPNIVVYSQLISAMSEARQWKKALSTYREMLDLGISPNSVTVASILRGFALAREWERAVSFYERVESQGVELDAVTLNTVLDALRRSGLGWEAAVNFLLKNPRRVNSANIGSYNTIISACSGVKEALSIFSLMANNTSIVPDAITYNTLIHKCSIFGAWEKTVMLVRQMRTASIDPDMRTYNSIINGFKHSGQWRRATAMLDFIEKKLGLRCDTVSYNSAMGACLHERKGYEAMRLFQQMGTRRIRRDIISFSTVIAAQAVEGRWREALGVFKSMRDEIGGKPSAIPYNSMIHAYGRARMWEEARALFETMTRERVNPTLVSYSSLINAYCLTNNWSQAIETYEEMKRVGIQPTAVTFTPLVKIIRLLDRQRALQLTRDMNTVALYPRILDLMPNDVDAAEYRGGFDAEGISEFSGDEGSWDVDDDHLEDSEEDYTRL